MYYKFNDLFDWMCFWDSDEYIKLYKHNTIQDWLSMECFKDVDVVAPNWRMMTDNGLIHFEDKPVLERFTEPCPYNVRTSYEFSSDNHIKSIIHCLEGKDIVFQHPHFARTTTGVPLKTVNASGKLIQSLSPFCEYDFSYASLDHYQTKSTEEFCHRRLSRERNYAMRRFDGTKITLKQEVKFYFILNKYTPKKLYFIMKFLATQYAFDELRAIFSKICKHTIAFLQKKSQ